MNKAIDVYKNPENEDYEKSSLGISYNQKGDIDFFCPHCNLNINLKNKIKKKTIDGHKINITKESVSFKCPCHGGWILSLKKKDIGKVLDLNLIED